MEPSKTIGQALALCTLSLLSACKDGSDKATHEPKTKAQVTESRAALERSPQTAKRRRQAQSALDVINRESHSNKTEAPITRAKEGLDQATNLLEKVETGEVDLTEVIDDFRTAVGPTDEILSEYRHAHREEISEETKKIIRAFIANTEGLSIALNLPGDNTRPSRVQKVIARSKKSIEEAKKVLDEIEAE